MCRPPILTSRNIGLAENALRALLTKALQNTGLDYHRWVALKLVADGQSPIPLTTLVDQLKDFLKMDEVSALAAINDLRTQGLVDTSDRISTTLRGRSLYERLCDETGRSRARSTPASIQTIWRPHIVCCRRLPREPIRC